MEIMLKTLTPLWTGDVNRGCSRIKETGIIGSLRWWYEALVRGLGGYACDPTSDEVPYKKCEFKKDTFNKAITSGESIQNALDEQICPACQLFGCTGWKKRLRFELHYNENGFDSKGYKADQEFIISINKLFLAKDLIEKCLVYARYHAKALQRK